MYFSSIIVYLYSIISFVFTPLYISYLKSFHKPFSVCLITVVCFPDDYACEAPLSPTAYLNMMSAFMMMMMMTMMMMMMMMMMIFIIFMILS